MSHFCNAAAHAQLPPYLPPLPILGDLRHRCCGCCSAAHKRHPPHPSPQIAPVVSAGSSQSRADVLVIVMSAVLVLTGLQWLSLKPKEPPQVELEGREVSHRAPGLPKALAAELQW